MIIHNNMMIINLKCYQLKARGKSRRRRKNKKNSTEETTYTHTNNNLISVRRYTTVHS